MDNTTDIRQILASNIRYLRLKKNITQEKFAESIGISSIAVSKLENGKCWPQRDTLERIIAYFGVHPYQLFIRCSDELDEYKKIVMESFSSAFDKSMQEIANEGIHVDNFRMNR